MTTPVVGRDAELARLDGILARALAGESAVCLVTGEAGAGKTSLVARFAELAQSRTPGLLVAVGTCDAYTGAGDPYLPFRDILQQLTGEVDESLASGRTTSEGATRLQAFARLAGRALVENGADLVGLFVPGGALLTRLGGQAAGNLPWVQKLQRRLHDQPHTQDTQTLQQENVFEQYTQVLEAMATERPLLLVVDDLHWADGASLGLLFHLARRLVKSRLLIVGTYRSDEIARQLQGNAHPLQGVVAELKRLHGELTVDLDNLQPTAFVDALLDARPNALDAAFRDSLARHTAGNPLFAVELLQSLTASGVLAEDASGRLVQSSPIEWGSLPSRVAGVIDSRLARLGASQREILSAAAVQGEEFLADVVAEVLRCDRRDVIRELSGPLQKELHLVTAIGLQDAGGRRVARYRFRHNLVQDYLYRQLDEIERAELHGATGAALEALHALDPEPVTVSLAAHFTSACDWSKAIRYRLLAADVARRRFAHEQSIDHLEHALALQATQGAVAALSPSQRAGTLESLADQLVIIRHWESAERNYRAGMELIDTSDCVWRARLLRKLARVLERQSRYDEATEFLAAATAVLGEPAAGDSTTSLEWIEIQLALSWLHYWRNDIHGMDATDALLGPVIDSLGSPLQQSQFYAARTRRELRHTRFRPGSSAVADAARALATIEAYPDEFLRAETSFLLGFTQLWAERFEEAAETFIRALDVCRRFGDTTHRLRSLVYLSICRRREGDAAAVARLNDEARELMRLIGSNEYEAVVLAQDAWLAWRAGDAVATRASLADLRRLAAGRSAQFPFQWTGLWVEVAVNAEDGRLEAAATAAGTMLRPPLARQRPEVEAQLERIVAVLDDRGADGLLAQEVALGIDLARRAGYL